MRGLFSVGKVTTRDTWQSVVSLCHHFPADHGGYMKTLSLLGLLVVLMMGSMSALGCPKGTHPVGGTGSHHKGGTCQ